MKKIIILLIFCLLLSGCISKTGKAVGLKENVEKNMPDKLQLFIKKILIFFKNRKTEPASVSDELYQWLDGKDLRGNDFSDKKDILLSSFFDSKTKWPDENKMPNEFNPRKIMEWGKDPGPGLQEIHQMGYTGKDVKIAVIDGILRKNHEEIYDNLKYYKEVQDLKSVGISFHGTAISSITVGKDLGVAPEALLYYFAIYDNPDKSDYQANIAEAIYQVIEYNENNFAKNKIRIIVSAMGCGQDKGGKKYYNAIKEAEKNNILVVYPDLNKERKDILKYYILDASCSYDDNKGDINNYQTGYWKSLYLRDIIILNKLAQDAKNWHDFIVKIDNKLNYFENHADKPYPLLILKFNNNINLLKKQYKNIVKLRKYLKDVMKHYSENVIHISAANRTIASHKGKRDYIYDGQGGISWTIPYYAGLAAIVLQINPDLNWNQIIEIIDKSAVINENVLRMVKPQKLVTLTKATLK